MGHADIVVQDVDAAKRVHRLAHGLLDGGLPGHVCGNRNGGEALLRDDLVGLVGRIETRSTQATCAPSRAYSIAAALPFP